MITDVAFRADGSPSLDRERRRCSIEAKRMQFIARLI
jgi:hypothetical protein